VGDREMWIEAERLAKLADGAVQVALLCEGAAEGVVNNCDIRIEVEGGAVFADGAIEVTLLCERIFRDRCEPPKSWNRG
jgi:hypothetical protein